MQTILAFINFLISLFNCTLSIFIFCLADELPVRPEKSIELSDTMKTFYPIEFILHNIAAVLAYFAGSWIQLAVCLPVVIYNIKFYFEGRHRLYASLGEDKHSLSGYNFIYKAKFVYYLVLLALCLLKFMLALTNMISYKFFGDTHLFSHIIKLIGLY